MPAASSPRPAPTCAGAKGASKNEKATTKLATKEPTPVYLASFYPEHPYEAEEVRV